MGWQASLAVLTAGSIAMSLPADSPLTGRPTSNPTSDPGTSASTCFSVSTAFEIASHVLATVIFLFLLVLVPMYGRFLDQQEMKLSAACVIVLNHARFVATYWYAIVAAYALAASCLFVTGQYLIKPLQLLRLCFFVGYFSLLAGYFLLMSLALLFVLIGQPVHLSGGGR
jgi:hypothetical protein